MFSNIGISNFIFDAVVSIMPITLVVILLSVAGTETWKGTNLAVAVLALFLYSLASIPQVYLFSYAFKSPLSSKVVTFVVAYLTGSILSLVSFILNFAGGTTEKVNTALTPVYRFFPGYNLGEVLLNLTINNFRKVSVWSEDMARDGIVTLSWEIFVYLACLIIIEYLISVPKIMAFIKSSLRMERDVPMDAFVEDDDVMSEKQRVKSSNDENSIIEVLGLRKVFKGFPSKKVAVKDLWFSIPRGECFGFLGINGAGKTTTLEILSGDLFPTRGTARLGGFDILSEQLKVRRLIGYCPQFDALIGNLTAREHLYMFARIKNVPEEEIRDIVNGMIKYLSLEEYANRPASTYSGGNKRKLSVAIALIGDPLIVFLDEPSTGVDPVARRFMWKFISDTMSGRSVILTTHSMDECEALCHRIGIMVGGRLRCLGSAQHLKNKFGSGYQFDVTVPVDFAEEFISQIRGLIKDIRLIERHEGAMKFQIPPTALSLADIFEIIEKNKQLLQINDYSVSQTTLEQIFIHFAKQQDEEKGVAKGFQGVDGLAPLGLSEGETHKELKIGECPQSEEVTTEPKV